MVRKKRSGGPRPSLLDDPDYGRRDLLNAALVAVVKASRRGVSIAVTQEARRLLRDHPKGGLTLEGISELLTKLAGQRDVKTTN
jgi:hypothetical protein